MLLTLPRRLMAVLLLAWRAAEAAPPVWQDWPLPLSMEARLAPVPPPEGWQVQADATPCHVLTLTVFDGLPQEQAALVPDTDQTLPGGQGRLSWTLTPVSASGTWVALGYTCKTLVLSRPLPPSATGLRVTYDARSRVQGLPRIVKAEIRLAAEPPSGSRR